MAENNLEQEQLCFHSLERETPELRKTSLGSDEELVPAPLCSDRGFLNISGFVFLVGFIFQVQG